MYGEDESRQPLLRPRGKVRGQNTVLDVSAYACQPNICSAVRAGLTPNNPAMQVENLSRDKGGGS